MKSKKIIIPVIIVVIALIGGIIFIKSRPSQSNGSEETIKQSTFKIREMPLTETYTTTGTVYSENDQTLTAGIATSVNTIVVKEGDRVSQGDPLMILDTTDLENEIKSTEYEVDSLKASISSSQITGATSLKNALSDAEKARADAQTDYDNAKSLYALDGISKSELDAYEDSVNTAQNKVKEAQDALNSYYAKDEVSLSLKKLEVLEYNLETLKEKMNNATVKAPFDGTVGEIYVNENDSVDASTALVRVIDMAHLSVQSAISEYDLYKFSTGLSATVSTLGNKDKTYEATISKIGIVGEVSGSEVSVPITMTIGSPEASDLLKPNFTATVDIVISNSPNALVVPFEAVTDRPDGQSIILKQSGDTLVPIQVTRGITNEIYVEVISDELSAGDTIVYSTSVAESDEAAGGFMMIGGQQGQGNFEGRPSGDFQGGNPPGNR